MKKKEQYISPKITLIEIENEGYLLAATLGGEVKGGVIFDTTEWNEEEGPDVSQGLHDGEEIP